MCVAAYTGPWPETPTTGICCDASAYNGPEACRCWVAEYDIEQQPPQPDLPTQTRRTMCGDCAYRPGSPERTGDPDALGTQEMLDGLVVTGIPFWCHQGIRQPVQWRHPSGMTIPGKPLDYRPAAGDDKRPYQADGTPAELCGGWAARHAAYLERGQL